MGAISFKEIWMVDKILKGLKFQTIRPQCKCKGHNGIHYPVGSIQKLLCKMRSTPKESMFCTLCNCRVWSKTHVTILGGRCQGLTFPKHFAMAKITEAFKIEMWQGNDVPLITGYSLQDTNLQKQMVLNLVIMENILTSTTGSGQRSMIG